MKEFFQDGLDVKAFRNASNFTFNREAPITEYYHIAGAGGTLTIPATGFIANDVIKIAKQAEASALTINASGSNVIYYPDGTTDTSASIPAGTAMTVSLIYNGTNTFYLSVQG